MSYAIEYDSVPISSSIPEFHFGNTGPVNMWVEFQTSDYQIWRGSFECGENGVREIVDIGDNRFIIIANGKAYLIDNDLKVLIRVLDYDNITFVHKININEVLIVNYLGVAIVNDKGMIKLVVEFLDLDEFVILNEDENYILAKVLASDFQWEERFLILDKIHWTYKIKKYL